MLDITVTTRQRTDLHRHTVTLRKKTKTLLSRVLDRLQFLLCLYCWDSDTTPKQAH